MKVLITGASGYVGARIYDDLDRNHEVVGTFYRNDCFEELRRSDVTDRSAVSELVSDVQPDAIVHAAAIASRSQCEANPQRAIATNARGTANVVEAANREGARVVYVSTLGAVELDSFYGETKRVGENYVEDTDAGYDVLRASMTYGYSPNTVNDRPFNRILGTLQEGQPDSYDDSWLFQPTYLGNLTEIIEYVLEDDPLDRTVDVVVPKVKTRFEVASDILEPFDCQIRPVMNRETQTRTGEQRTTGSDLPTWSYDEMIRAITGKIREHELVDG